MFTNVGTSQNYNLLDPNFYDVEEPDPAKADQSTTRVVATDLVLKISSNGGEEFRFLGELEVRYCLIFSNPGMKGQLASKIYLTNQSRIFRIAVKVCIPYELQLDYQILNPVVRHLNYENNVMKKVLVAGEKSLICLTLENRSSLSSHLEHPIFIQELKFYPTEQDSVTPKSSSSKSTAVITLPGADYNGPSIQVIANHGLSGEQLSEREQAKVHFYFLPLVPKADLSLGKAVLKWRRVSNSTQSANQCSNCVTKTF